MSGRAASMLARREWVPAACEARVQALAASVESGAASIARIEALATRSRAIHERECFNLNPATNVMNPRAEALLSVGLGTRPSLGYPGDKYEMGLEAIEEIEVVAAELCARVFRARYAEVRVFSGAMANLYAFMATSRPGDRIIVPPASIGGHVTHHDAGCAGLYGLEVHEAPIDADGYSLDVAALGELAARVRPSLITVGGSLNPFPHPVAEVRAVADGVGARVLFDAAHQCGVIAGSQWPNPLDAGADVMTMSTYKSLAGPAGGLLVTNDAGIAEKLDRIAFPGMTANSDAGRIAALAVTMVDWLAHGETYARRMVELARAFAEQLDTVGVPVFARERGFTRSHQFAVEAARYGGGQTISKGLRNAGFLACGIGLPIAPVEGDLNGLRIGTPELARWGVRVDDVPAIAALLVEALDGGDTAARVADMRARFDTLAFVS